MIPIQTIGTNLVRMEKAVRRKKTSKRQRVLNILTVWIFLLLLGIGLGYAWRMQQTKPIAIITPSETFKPFEIVIPSKYLSQLVPHKSRRLHLQEKN